MATLLLFGTDPQYYDIGEVVGYSSIVISLLFIFFGLKEYQKSNGGLSFWESLKIGMGISLFPAAFFGAYNVVYAQYIDPEFMTKYSQHAIDKLKDQNLSPTELETAQATMQQQMEMFGGIEMQFLVMFFTVFIIGIVISIVSGTILLFSKQNN